MRNIGMSKLQNLLFVLLMFALAGCGASNSNIAGNPGNASSTVTAKLVFPDSSGKSTAKSVAATAVPTGIASLKTTVTGSDINGNALPVVRNTVLAGYTTSRANGIYPGYVSLVVQALDANGNVLFEGFATNVVVVAGQSTSAGVINMSVPIVKTQDAACPQCHETTLDTNGQNLIAGYKQSKHYMNTSFTVPSTVATSGYGATQAGCAGCHGQQHQVTDPSTSGVCYQCHGTPNANHANSYLVSNSNTAIVTNNCATCHLSHNIKGGGGCLGCHSIPQNANTNNNAFVNDNNGVRAVVPEFTKNAHHVVGKVLTNEDCAVCHMEGTIGGAVNPAYHMSDNKVHLRNGNPALVGNQSTSDGVQYIWDPANPNHTAMDQFCMSCHNAQGSTAAAGLVPGNTPKNPFNDAISNGYDQMNRPAVVDVFNQFDTGNTSHHAVRGKKYNGAYRSGNPYNVATAGHSASTASLFTQYSGSTVGNVLYRASNPAAPVQVQEYFGSYSTAYGASGYGPKSPGTRKTLYEAGLFTPNFTTLNGNTLGDDSTLHCGDCHTVGQYAPGVANAVTPNSDGTFNIITAPAVIGAHGSANEYLLRNSIGTDALQLPNNGSTSNANSAGVAVPLTYGANGLANNIQANNLNGTYVCYLCHNQIGYNAYNSGYQYKNAVTGVVATALHVGSHQAGCIGAPSDSTGLVGYAARVGAIGTLRSVFGNACSNCHAGGNMVFGGIHGNANFGALNVGYKTYSTNGKDMATAALAGQYSSAIGKAKNQGGTGKGEFRNSQLNVTTRAPYRFAGGVSLKFNGGGTASKWEMRSMAGAHREGCYNLSPTTTGVNTWSQPATSNALVETNYQTGVANNLPLVANSVADDNSLASNNGTTSGWGSCNHHQGAGNSSATGPTRMIQRPLNY